MSFDKQNLSGNVIHKRTWKDNVYYNEWTGQCSSWRLVFDSAVQDCTSLGLASLDVGGG